MRTLSTLFILLALFAVAQCQSTQNKTNTFDDETINVFICPHTHDDTGWLVTTDQYYVKQVRYILDTVVAALKVNKNRKFNFVEQAFFQRWWYEQNDKTKEDVRQLVKEGRLEFNIGGWSMPDEATTHYEDVINEMTLGAKFLYDEFGIRPTVGWHPDTFGHSNQMAAIYADMGFDSFTFWRIHYAEDRKRKEQQELEFVWRGSKSLDAESDVFAHVFDSGYGSPDECEFLANSSGETWYWTDDNRWFQWDNDLPTYKNNEEYHAKRFSDMIHNRIKWFDNGRNYLIPWGTDFTFVNAFVPFDNMDKFIDYMNSHQEIYHIHMQYAVLSDYIKTVHQYKKNWSVKRDDFLPYAYTEPAYWTGFYSSRDRTKGMVRQRMNELSNAEMYMALSKATKKNLNYEELVYKIMKLRKAQGEVQHHDGITGTNNQAVADDYIVQLTDGGYFTNEAASSMLDVYTTLEGINKNATEIFPQLTNENSIVVLLSNPLPWTRKETIQLILPRSDIGVYDKNGKEIESQINEIPEFSYDRRNGTHYLYFVHEIPPMGYSSVYLKIKKDAHVELPIESTSISNDKIKLSTEHGYVKQVELSSGKTVQLNATYYHYEGSNGYPERSTAYAFIPAYIGHKIVGKSDIVQQTIHTDLSSIVHVDKIGYITSVRAAGSFDDIIVSNIQQYNTTSFDSLLRRIDGDKEQGWGQELALNYIHFDMEKNPKNTLRDIVYLNPPASSTSFEYTLKFNPPFAKDENVHIFTQMMIHTDGYATITLKSVNNEQAVFILSLYKTQNWGDHCGFFYVAFTDHSYPFEEHQNEYIYGYKDLVTDENGRARITVQSKSYFVNNRILIQFESEEPGVALVGAIGEYSFEVSSQVQSRSKNVPVRIHYLALPTQPISEDIIPKDQPVQMKVIKGPLVEEIQQIFRDGYYAIYRLYKEGIQSRIIEVINEFNGIDEGHEVVQKFQTDLKNEKTIYADTMGMEQQKREYLSEITQPLCGNFYPCVARAYIEDRNRDLRLSAMIDRSHGVSSREEGVMEIMLKRRTPGPRGIIDPLNENDQVKQRMWLLIDTIEESSIYRQYDQYLNHYPIQFFGLSKENQNIVDQYSSLNEDLPPEIQIVNLQLAQSYDKTLILRLHHIYEIEESKEHSVPVSVDLSKIFKDFTIVDYDEMILTGMFKRSDVEEERMKWKTTEESQKVNDLPQESRRSIRGHQSFIVTLKPMEFKTFQITVA